MKGTTVGQTTCLLKAKSVFLPATLEGEARSLPFYSCNTLPAWSLSKNSGQSRHFWQSVLEGIHGVALVIHRERVKCEVRQFEPSLLVNHCVKRTWLFCLISLFGSGGFKHTQSALCFTNTEAFTDHPSIVEDCLGGCTSSSENLLSLTQSSTARSVWSVKCISPCPEAWRMERGQKLETVKSSPLKIGARPSF